MRRLRTDFTKGDNDHVLDCAKPLQCHGPQPNSEAVTGRAERVTSRAARGMRYAPTLDGPTGWLCGGQRPVASA